MVILGQREKNGLVQNQNVFVRNTLTSKAREERRGDGLIFG